MSNREYKQGYYSGFPQKHLKTLTVKETASLKVSKESDHSSEDI